MFDVASSLRVRSALYLVLPLGLLAPMAVRAEVQTVVSEEIVRLPSYESAFQGYQSWSPVQDRDWKAANRRVDEIGGWRAYLEEAAAAESGASAHQHEQHQHGHSGGGGRQP